MEDSPDAQVIIKYLHFGFLANSHETSSIAEVLGLEVLFLWYLPATNGR